MLTRFARFNVVGVIGFGVQAAALSLLVRAGVPVPLATLLAVEAAVLHNFAWHERWTWASQLPNPKSQIPRVARLKRLGAFHAANGLVSLAGNAIFTTALALAGMPLVLSSLAAVLACSVVNFALADRVVFADRGSRTADRGSGCDLCRAVVPFPSYGSPRIRRSSTWAWLKPRTRAAPSSSRARVRTT